MKKETKLQPDVNPKELTQILPSVNELKSNGVGNVENEKNRLRALGNLEQAKKLELAKKQKGYRWMRNGKTNAYVHPDRFDSYKEKGFKFI